MKHLYSKKDYVFLEKFKNTTLNINNFHHREHIQVTYVLLIENSVEETYLCIKNSILNILKAVNADLSKYHETMTYAWIEIVNYFMMKTDRCYNFDEFILSNQELLNTNIIYKHYSKELLENEKARMEILEADIEKIVVNGA